MNAHNPSKLAAASVPLSGAAVITADASKVSQRQFARLFRPPPVEQEGWPECVRQACLTELREGKYRGWGFPKDLVAECKQIIAEEDALESGWAKAERSAYGMGGSK